jgi:hypothetical protein
MYYSIHSNFLDSQSLNVKGSGMVDIKSMRKASAQNIEIVLESLMNIVEKNYTYYHYTYYHLL